MSELKDLLIGGKLKEIDEYGFCIVKNKKEYQFEYEEDHGDCCGYTDIENNLLISEEDLSKNPVITNIIIEKNISSCSHETMNIVLYGENKKICEINAEAGSGSGWQYGACVRIKCKLLNYCETLVEW